MADTNEGPTRPLPAVEADKPPKGSGPSRGMKIFMLSLMLLAISAGIALVVWKVILPRVDHSSAAGQSQSAGHLPRGTVSTVPPSRSPSGSPSPTPTARPSSRPTVAPLPPSLRALQADLNSSNRATQSQAVLPEERASVGIMVPAGYQLSMDPSTFRLVNSNEHDAVVMATVTHGPADPHGQRYQLGLYRKDPGSPWLLAISKEV